MVVDSVESDAGEVCEWAPRSNHWLDSTPSLKPRRKRERRAEPLILCGHGISLRVDKGALLIRDGFTHYPQAQAEHRFFPGDLDRPPTIIVLDGSGSLSFDVIDWLSEQDVTLVRINWKGEVSGVVGRIGSALDAAKIEWQRKTRADPAARLAFGVETILRKIARFRETLTTCFPETSSRARALELLDHNEAALSGGAATNVPGLLGIEGQATRAYFRLWSGMPMRLTGRPHSFPPTWLAYEQRASLVTGRKWKNWKASHPINAMLNYAYAVLQAKVQISAIAEGYDPRLGILHNSDQGSPAFALDLMEPERPKIDAAVLKFVSETTFTAADFTLRSDGVVRLNPQLARRVVGLAGC